MNIKDFNEREFSDLVANFWQDEEKTVKNAESIIGLLKDGRVPSSSIIECFNKGISQLEETYFQIKRAAEDVISDDSLLSQDFSVSEYESRITEKHIRELKTIQARLVKFLQVQSDVKKYQDALVPFQNQARELLGSFEDLNVNDQRLQEENQREQVFFQALEKGEMIDDDDEFSNLILTNYNKKVYGGLLQRKYHIAEATEDLPENRCNVSQATYSGEEKQIKNDDNIDAGLGEITPDEDEISLPGTEVVRDNDDMQEDNNLGDNAKPDVISAPSQNSEGKSADATVVERLVDMPSVTSEPDKLEQTSDEFKPREAEEVSTQDLSSPSEMAEDASEVGLDIMTGRSPAEMASIALDKNNLPTDSDFMRIIEALLYSSPDNSEIWGANYLQAFLLAMAVKDDTAYPQCSKMSKKLALALDISVEEKYSRSGETITEVFGNDNDNLSLYLKYCACCHALLRPNQAYDTTLGGIATEMVHHCDGFPVADECTQFLHKLRETLDNADLNQGFTPDYISALTGNNIRAEKIKQLKDKANKFLVTPSYNAGIAALPIFANNVFGKKSDLYFCLEAVKLDDRDFSDDVTKKYHEINGTRRQTLEFDNNSVNNYIDNKWAEALKNSKGPRQLTSVARTQTVNRFQERLEVIREWINLGKGTVSEKIQKAHEIVVNLIKRILEVLSHCPNAGKGILENMFKHLSAVLAGKEQDYINNLLTDLLRTGYLVLDDSGFPIQILDINKQPICHYEGWRNMLKHISHPEFTLKNVAERIMTQDSDCFDNFDQLKYLVKCGVLSQDINSDAFNADVKQACLSAEKNRLDFMAVLALAFTYGYCDEEQEEYLQNCLEINQSNFYDMGKTKCWGGCWEQFIKTLKQSLEEHKQKTIEEWTRKISECQGKYTGEMARKWSNEAQRQIAQANVSAAEECLTHAEYNDNYELINQSDGAGANSVLSEFISMNDNLRSICNNATKIHGTTRFAKVGSDFIKSASDKTRDWGKRHFDSSKELLRFWPQVHPWMAKTELPNLLKELGFSLPSNCQVTQIEKAKELRNTVSAFKVTILPAEKHLRNYNHPISEFGTCLNSLNVVVLPGARTPEEIMEALNTLNLSEPTLILVNSPIKLDARRRFAYLLRSRGVKQQTALVVDQILCLYLALHDRASRLNIMLQCAIAFSVYQPFGNGSGAIPDEMFFGRAKELNQIVDHNGACIVYGGRQLGKTAILQRVAAFDNQPADKRFAIYINIQNCPAGSDSEQWFCHEMSETFSKYNLPELPNQCDTIEELCKHISLLFEQQKVKRLLLLIDEADKFFTSLATITPDMSMLVPLINLWKNLTIDFKCVWAGLHNVCRASKHVSNTAIAQFGEPLCIEPLSGRDALNLLQKPLSYLGVQLDERQCATLLANTNYYPGMVQLAGHILVDYLNGSEHYDVRRNPPFILQDKELGNIILNNDLRKQIRDKFNLSLELDQRYKALALTIVYLLSCSEREVFGAGEILNACDELKIQHLKGVTENEIYNLLIEMEKMGVLTQNNNMFKLRRRRFIKYIAENDGDLLDKLQSMSE